tara:strand:+ start:332 stop:478 length:147 start_codon:yes stop_codon:yes gene_type:complete
MASIGSGTACYLTMASKSETSIIDILHRSGVQLVELQNAAPNTLPITR